MSYVLGACKQLFVVVNCRNTASMNPDTVEDKIRRYLTSGGPYSTQS